MNLKRLCGMAVMVAAALMTVSMPEASAQTQKIRTYETIFGRNIRAKNACHKGKEYERVDVNDMRAVAFNILKFQNSDGGWPRSLDYLDKTDLNTVLGALKESHRRSCVDTKNTCMQLEYVSQAYVKFGEERFKMSALRAINFLLKLQMACGAWPSRDVEVACLNNHTTTACVKTMWMISQGKYPYEWIPSKLRKMATESYERGLNMILKCQLHNQAGEPTGWGQQYDPVKLVPVKAGLSQPCVAASETSQIIAMLMSLDNPSNEVKKAVVTAAKWLEGSKIKGIRIEQTNADAKLQAKTGKPFDRHLVQDAKAKPIWARCYGIEDNKPFFYNRNGTHVADFNHIDDERRVNYGWYGYWPETVLVLVRAWKAKWRVK